MLVRLAVLACVALSFAASASAAGRVPPPTCVCLDAENAQVQGVTQRLAHTGPLNPYLRPNPTRAAPTER